MIYIMSNKRLKDKHLKEGLLEYDEDPLVCNNVTSDDELLIDSSHEVTPIDLQENLILITLIETKKG